MKARVFTILFILTAIIELFAEAMESEIIIFIAKPLLMIFLILMYRFSLVGKPKIFHKLIISAFVFAWFGDVLLMFSSHNEIYFLLGLVSFLITHLLYARAFIKSVNADSEKGIVISNPLFALPVLLFGIGLIYVLYDGLGEMRIPVIIYSSAIMLMVIAAINRYGRVSRGSFWMVLIGAVMFMLSDSMIALNKFNQPFEMARTAIMLTYIIGQYYIAIGCLQKDADQNESIPIP